MALLAHHTFSVTLEVDDTADADLQTVTATVKAYEVTGKVPAYLVNLLAMAANRYAEDRNVELLRELREDEAEAASCAEAEKARGV